LGECLDIAIKRKFNCKRLLDILSSPQIKDMMKSFREAHATAIVPKLIYVLMNDNENRATTLRLLGYICYETNINVKLAEEVLNAVISFCDYYPNAEKLSRLALNCLANLFMKFRDKFQAQGQTVLQKLGTILRKLVINARFEQSSYLKLLNTLLRAFNHCLSEQKVLESVDMSDLFTNMSHFLYLGPTFKNRLRIHAQMIPHEMEDSSAISTSDFSEIEGLGKEDPEYYFKKIKILILLCFQSIFRLSPKLIYQFWTSILPSMSPIKMENNQITNADSLRQTDFPSSLVYLLLFDESPKVRTTASTTISCLLESSPITKWLQSLDLSLANRAKGATGFGVQHMSVNVANYLELLHSSLHYAMTKETDPVSLGQILKTCGNVISCTPYTKLDPDLIESLLIPQIERGFFVSEDSNIRMGSLICFSSAFNISPGMDQISKNVLDDSISPNILQYLLDNVKSFDNTHQIEILIIFCRIAKGYSKTLGDHWDSLHPILSFFLDQEEKKLKICSIKVLEEWIKASNQNYTSEATDGTGGDGLKEETKEDQTSSDNEIAVWSPFNIPSFSEFLYNTLLQLNKSDASDLACACLNLISSISEDGWNQFNDKQVDCLIRLGLESKFNNTATEKAAVMRMLGSTINLPYFKEHCENVSVVIEKVITNSHDQNANISIRNSWALANTCSVIDDFGLIPLNEIIKCCVNYCSFNKEKVVSNAIRALGYLTRKLSYERYKHLEIEITTKSGEKKSGTIFNVIIENIIGLIMHKSPKVCWNACVALGNLLQNDEFPLTENSNLKPLIESLLRIFTERQNFKAKIHCAQTLKLLRKREHFGDMFTETLKTIVISLQDAESTTDFYDYKYREILESNLCRVLCQLIMMAEKSDGEELLEFLTDYTTEIYFTLDNCAQEQAKLAEKKLQLLTMEEPALDRENSRSQDNPTATLENKVIKGEIEEYVAKFKEELGKLEPPEDFTLIQSAAKKLTTLIESNQDLRISFGTIESLRELANAPLESFVDADAIKSLTTGLNFRQIND